MNQEIISRTAQISLINLKCTFLRPVSITHVKLFYTKLSVNSYYNKVNLQYFFVYRITVYICRYCDNPVVFAYGKLIFFILRFFLFFLLYLWWAYADIAITVTFFNSYFAWEIIWINPSSYAKDLSFFLFNFKPCIQDLSKLFHC